MSFESVVCCRGRGLCEGVVSRPEESYRVCVCVIVRLQRVGIQRSRLKEGKKE